VCRNYVSAEGKVASRTHGRNELPPLARTSTDVSNNDIRSWSGTTCEIDTPLRSARTTMYEELRAISSRLPRSKRTDANGRTTRLHKTAPTPGVVVVACRGYFSRSRFLFNTFQRGRITRLTCENHGRVAGHPVRNKCFPSPPAQCVIRSRDYRYIRWIFIGTYGWGNRSFIAIHALSYDFG